MQDRSTPPATAAAVPDAPLVVEDLLEQAEDLMDAGGNADEVAELLTAAREVADGQA